MAKTADAETAPDLARLKRLFEEARDLTREARNEALLDLDYYDTDEALAATDSIFSGVQLLKAGRALRIAREAELNAVLRACSDP